MTQAIKTNGVGTHTKAHLNLTKSLADVYDIVLVHVGQQSIPTWKWIKRRKK